MSEWAIGSSEEESEREEAGGTTDLLSWDSSLCCNSYNNPVDIEQGGMTHKILFCF